MNDVPFPPLSNRIFVFGSNLAGRHGKGAALAAQHWHGAIYGQGEGLQGRSYAIPTKDARLRTLPLEWVHYYVLRFLDFAQAHPELVFRVTPIGCGLAGYRPEQIAPFFAHSPANVVLPPAFLAVTHRYPSITCPRCGLTSYNHNDIAQRYCAKCHDWNPAP
jgi:hypothetical protein